MNDRNEDPWTRDTARARATCELTRKGDRAVTDSLAEFCRLRLLDAEAFEGERGLLRGILELEHTWTGLITGELGAGLDELSNAAISLRVQAVRASKLSLDRGAPWRENLDELADTLIQKAAVIESVVSGRQAPRAQPRETDMAVPGSFERN